MDISVQACKEEFLTNHPGQNVLEKSLADNPFVTTGNVEKGKWCTWQYMSLNCYKVTSGQKLLPNDPESS
jgi:hypothetical protein